MTDKVIGDSKMCVACGKTIVCRMTAYADYPNKPQWQNEGDTKAHYDKTGKCKNDDNTADYGTPSTASNPAPFVTKTMSVNDYAIAAQRKIGDQILETKRLQEKFKELVESGELPTETTEYSVMKLYIRMLELCDAMGITDEIKRGMLSNQANIRASG